MITITCDICGKPATIGLDCTCYGMHVTKDSLHMYPHHICHDCAAKIGVIEHLEAMEAETKRALAQNGIIPCEIVEDNKEEQAK